MTPQEKAKEIIGKYISNQNKWYLKNLVDGLRICQAKIDAITAIELIIKECDIKWIEYWQEVKKEIEIFGLVK
jgi:hypothetical protein